MDPGKHEVVSPFGGRLLVGQIHNADFLRQDPIAWRLLKG